MIFVVSVLIADNATCLLPVVYFVMSSQDYENVTYIYILLPVYLLYTKVERLAIITGRKKPHNLVILINGVFEAACTSDWHQLLMM